jgi:hypothetical protein
VTTLGIIFIAAYGISLIWGRRGLLVVLSSALAFNDSAAIVVGGATLTPFYFGVLIYVVVAGLSRRTRARGGNKRDWVPWVFLVLALIGAVFAPMMFSGVGVVAPGIGLDDQAATLTPLAYTASSFAQAAYLVLNIVFLSLNERDRLLTTPHIALGLLLGVIVGLWAWSSWRLGVPFPQAVFDNSPRGFYATNNVRLRGQFAEPSHMGAFSLTATLFYVVYLFQSRRAYQAILRFVLAACSVLLLVSSASGTAVMGVLVSVGILVVIGIYQIFRRLDKIRIPWPALLAAVVLLVAVVVVSPVVESAVTNLIAAKQGGESITTRNSVNAQAWDIVGQTGGFGVGLGNNRASSLALMLPSTIGIVCTLFFAYMVFRAMRNGLAASSTRAVAVALVGFMSAAVISFADFVNPFMWLAIALCYSRSMQDSDVGLPEPAPLQRPLDSDPEFIR